MLEIIDKKYINEKYTKMALPTDSCHLIISENEIIYLKSEGRIFIDKYSNSSNNPSIETIEKENDYRFSTQLFEYNKEYFDFSASITSSYNLKQFEIFKGTDRALSYSNNISMDKEKTKIESLILNREELEKIFDSNKYDSMYILDKNGLVIFAKDEKNGIVIDKKIIPTDEEIIEREYKYRKNMKEVAHIIVNSLNSPKKIIKRKTIDEIENVKLYSPFFGIYSHILLTVKNGVISAKWFGLNFIKKDNFELVVGEVPIKRISIDDVLETYKKDYLHTINIYEDRIKILEEQINSKEASSKKLLLKRKNI